MKSDGWMQARAYGLAILRAMRFLACCLCYVILVIMGGMLHGLDLVSRWLHTVLPAAYPALYSAARRCSPVQNGDTDSETGIGGTARLFRLAAEPRAHVAEHIHERDVGFVG